VILTSVSFGRDLDQIGQLSILERDKNGNSHYFLR